MNALIKFLIRNRFIELSPKLIEKWLHEQNDEMLVYAYENGIYNIRKLAVESMGLRQTEQLNSIIERAIDDNIMSVSLAAIEILLQYDLSDEYFEKIENKSDFWLQKSKNTVRVGYRRKVSSRQLEDS